MNHTKGQVYPDGTVAYYKDAKAREMISTDYDSTASYAVGDYCMYDNVRYCCNTAIGSGGETWNSAHWDVAKVDDDVSEIKQSLSDKVDKTWIGLGSVTGTGSFTLTNSVEGKSEVLIGLFYGNDIRQTVLVPINYFKGGNAFPDFILANVRCYFGFNYVDNTHINVTSFEHGALNNVTFVMFAR